MRKIGTVHFSGVFVAGGDKAFRPVERPFFRWPGAKPNQYRVADQPWGFYGFNFAHFRHTGGVAVVAYLDGHVEAVRYEDAVPDPSFCPAEFVAARRANQLGFAAADNAVYTGE